MVHFYAWQHGMGCHKKLPKEQELLQLPGRGKLDFTPIVSALKAVGYNGWTEIFMHPVPRGIPILPTARQVTDQINRSRKYLEACLKKTSNHTRQRQQVDFTLQRPAYNPRPGPGLASARRRAGNRHSRQECVHFGCE
jgi:hypothetical protein